MDLITELERFRPWNEQEERDLAELLRRLRSGEELYSRENLSAHLTASAWVTKPLLKKRRPGARSICATATSR